MVIQPNVSGSSSAGAQERPSLPEKKSWSTICRCFVFATVGIQDMPNEVMQVMCSIHRQIRMCAEAEGGHFEQLL